MPYFAKMSTSGRLLYPVLVHQGLVFFAISPPYTLSTHQILDSHEPVQDRLRPRRATGYIHINRNDLVNSLQHRISIKNTPARRTRAHCHNPPRFRHLQVYLLQGRPHFLRDRPHHHQQITLPRCKGQPFGPKTCQIIVRRHHRHELDATARSRKRQRPKRILPRQTNDTAQLRRKEPLSRITLGSIRQTDILFDIRLDGVNIESYRTCHSTNIFKCLLSNSRSATPAYAGSTGPMSAILRIAKALRAFNPPNSTRLSLLYIQIPPEK